MKTLFPEPGMLWPMPVEWIGEPGTEIEWIGEPDSQVGVGNPGVLSSTVGLLLTIGIIAAGVAGGIWLYRRKD